MNVLELKHKIKTWDNNKTFLKLIAISILITAIFFPLNLALNPNVDPVVYEHPYLLGFGFAAFVLLVVLAFAGGVAATLMVLDSYLIVTPKVLDSIGKINSSTIWRDDSFLDRLSYGIHTRVLQLSKKYNDPKIEELQQGDLRQQTEIDDVKQEINTLKENRILDMNEYRKVNNQLAEAKIENAKLLKENKSKELDIQKAFTKFLKLEEELKKLKGD